MKYILITLLFFTTQVKSQEIRDAKTLEVSGDSLFLKNITTGARTSINKTGLFLSKADTNVNVATKTELATKATITALNLKANIDTPAFTGALTTTGSLGYTTGAGGTVTQATNKSTSVTLNKITGNITMNGAALAAAAIVSFTLTNSTVAATDQILVQHQTTGTFGAYTLSGRTAAGSAVISVRNNTAGSLSEAIVIKYTIIKSVTN